MLPVETSQGLGVGVFWFGFSPAELRFRNPDELTLTRGDRLRELRAFTVDGVEVTERDLTAQGPALLTLYRGWWCPTSKAQMNTILAQSDALIDARVALFAGSVDEPAEARPIQESVGDAITRIDDHCVTRGQTVEHFSLNAI